MRKIICRTFFVEVLKSQPMLTRFEESDPYVFILYVLTYICCFIESSSSACLAQPDVACPLKPIFTNSIQNNACKVSAYYVSRPCKAVRHQSCDTKAQDLLQCNKVSCTLTLNRFVSLSYMVSDWTYDSQWRQRCWGWSHQQTWC